MKKKYIVLTLLLSGCIFDYDVPSYSKYVSNSDFDTVYVVSNKVYKIPKGEFVLVHFPTTTQDIMIYKDETLNDLLFTLSDTELKAKETKFIQANKNYNYTSDAIFITKDGIIVDFKNQ